MTVARDEDSKLDVSLEAATVQLGGVVTSASRRVEKITDAPATITRIDEAQIANSIGNSFASALKEVKGLEFIQTGILTSAVNARGFNSSFNNRILQVEDGRIGVLPLPISLRTSSDPPIASARPLRPAARARPDTWLSRIDEKRPETESTRAHAWSCR